MALTFSKGIAVVAALCLIMLLLCLSCRILGYTYYVWQERYRIELQLCSAVVPAVHDVEVTWTTDGSHWEIKDWSEYLMRRKLRFSSMPQMYELCYGKRALPQNIGVRFTDEGGKRHEVFASPVLPPKFGGTIILVLKRQENLDGYELAMYIDKYNWKELWKRFSWNDLSIKRTLQSPQERSRFNFGLLTDAGSPLPITWFKNNYYHVYEEEAQTLVATPAVLSKGGMVWAKEVTVLPTPREVDIAFRLPDGKGEFRLDSLLQSDRGPDPLPENFKGDIVALVHEGAGGFELRIFLAPFDSLATLPDAETLLKVLEAKYASSHDRRDVTENRAPSPNGVPVYREMYGKCELIVCDGVLPPP